MPAKGRVLSRPFDAAERTALADQTSEVFKTSEVFAILGEETCDIFLNDKAHWKNVPRPVWEYTLGGYQVLKKWLSYREQTLLGRQLTFEEVNHFRDVVRRITALLLLGPTLDANYTATKANTQAWARS